ncbi:YwqG family protein [uncultured Corynebacterium sp.]|uniref:YwqG family protein n=1 Tax=uncultured Corynebacterium sp. TaxID=159447 RepID=UPI0025EBC953|nr:YwqG family protein [uncultured Corynebacterium sp.]
MTAEDDFYALKYSFDSVPTRPIIDFAESSRPDSPTTSKLCGTPYLPEHAQYPEYDDEPMFFIAQFNFAELEPLPGFPKSGLLQLFVPGEYGWGMELCDKYVATGERASTPFARYLEDLSAPHVGEVPEEVEDSGEHPAEEPLEATTIDGKLSELSVIENAHEFGRTAFWNNDLRALLRRGEDLVDVHTYGWDIITRRVIDGETTIEATKLPGDTKDGQKEMFDEIVARVEAEGFSVDPTAEESEERVNLEDGQCEVRLGGYATYWNPSKLPIGDEHITLATVDNGGTFEWGDGGIGNFYIHPEDLAARNFDKVLFDWDCG